MTPSVTATEKEQKRRLKGLLLVHERRNVVAAVLLLKAVKLPGADWGPAATKKGRGFVKIVGRCRPRHSALEMLPHEDVIQIKALGGDLWLRHPEVVKEQLRYVEPKQDPLEQDGHVRVVVIFGTQVHVDSFRGLEGIRVSVADPIQNVLLVLVLEHHCAHRKHRGDQGDPPENLKGTAAALP